MLENEGFAAVTATAAPKMHALTTKYLNLSNYNSTSHPSLPDYCAVSSGSWLGKAGSDSGTIGFAGNHANVFAAVAAKGFTWKAYEEGVSQGSNYTAWTGSGTGNFASRHCPAEFYTNTDSKPANGAASGRFDFRGGPTGNLLADISNKTLPDFFFITPNLQNDGHDSSLTYADNWLAGNNPQGNSPAFPGIDTLIAALRPGGCILITFDNPGSTSGTHIYGCIVGPNVAAQTISTFHSHLTALYGVQQEFGIPKFTDSNEIAAYINLTSGQALPWPTSSGPASGPSVTSISPNSGPIGTTVTITGTGFTGASSVTFGSTAATFTVVSSTQISAVVPSLSDATYTVNVVVSAQTASLVNGFTVTSAVGITGFTPTSGPVGTLVTITGTSGSFVGVTSVTFHGTNAVFSVLSQTQIQATVPSGATTGTISVVTSNGTLTSLSNFTVTAGGGGGGTPVTSLNLLIVPCQRTGTPLPGSLSTWQANMARVQALWQSASYGQLALSYTFSETANLDPALAVNDSNALRGAALSWLAANSGVQWWTFDAIVYFGPDALRLETGSGEGFIPAGVFGPYPGGDGETSPVFAAHEIGHLLGLNHAGLDTITPFLGTATLQSLEGLNDNATIYGDGYDPMGANLYLSQPNAHAKNRLGWLGPKARTINTTGTYNLDALELATATNPQALVMAGQSGIQYWLEYRVPGATEDLDSAANTAAPALFSPSGVTIRIRAGNTVNADQESDAQRSFLLSVGSSSKQLPAGQTFTDPGGSLQIHINSAGASTAAVQVTNPVAPTLVPQENLGRPGGVSNLVVNTAASDSTHAALIWTHPVNATGVTAVYRDGTQVTLLAAGTANYTDTVAAGSTHSYTVTTNTAAGVGGPSSNLVTYTASNPVVGSKPAIPTSGAYYGMTAAVRNGRTAAQELAYVEGSTQANRQVTVIHRYHNWDNPPLDGYETGIAPPHMLSVNWFAANHAGTFATWPDIANGVYDSRITTAANSFASYGHPMWFCFHMEPENDTATCGTAADFVNAYRHVHGIIAAAAPNVAFVWNLIAATFRAGTQAQWYPGDSYVDWTAADGYNWYNQGGHSDPWKSLSDIFTAFYNDSLTRNKPAMIAEYGTIDGTSGTSGTLSKGDWFTLALSIMKGWPNLKYAAYFNSQPFNTSPNWWFDNDPTGTNPSAYPRDKFKAISNDAYFTPLFGGSGGGGGGPTSIATTPDSGTPGFYDPTFTSGSHKGRVDDVIVANNVVYVAHSAPDVTDSGTTLTTVPNLTAYRRDTKRVETAWRPNPNGRVYRLQQLGSSLIAAGAFSTIGGQSRGGIARFTPLSSVSDTSSFALASTPGNLAADGAVHDVIFNSALNVAWVAGDFNNIGGSARRGVARFTVAGDGTWTLDTGFNANVASFIAGGGGRCLALKPDETKLVYGAHPGNGGTDVHTIPSLLALDPSTGGSLTWANKIFYTIVSNEHPGAFEMRWDSGGVYIGGLWNGGNSLCYFDWNGGGPNSVTIQANCNPTTASTSSVTSANCIWYFGCDGNVQTVGLVGYGGKQLVAAGHHGDVVASAKNHESGTAASPGPVGVTTSHGLFLVTTGSGGGVLDGYKNPPSFGSGADGDPLKLWAIYQDPTSGDLHVGGDFTNINSETNDLHRRYAVFTASGTPPPPPPGDITPPSAPTNLGATAENSSTIALNWASSTDNVGVTGYRIYRDGRLVGTVPGP